jgi:hypothetical protein
MRNTSFLKIGGGLKKKNDITHYDITFTITMVVKQGKLKCIECMNKSDEFHDVSTCYTKFLKYDPF